MEGSSRGICCVERGVLEDRVVFLAPVRKGRHGEGYGEIGCWERIPLAFGLSRLVSS